jgi:hypothetical protein
LGTQAQLLSISRRSLYYQATPPPPQEVAIKHRIDELYTAHPFYGSRKLTLLLAHEFGAINRKRVQRGCPLGPARDGHRYGSPRQARAGIGKYFQFYTSERPYQALDYRRPAELYLG